MRAESDRAEALAILEAARALFGLDEPDAKSERDGRVVDPESAGPPEER